MPNARVGAMPQPNRQHDIYPGRGGWKNRVTSGMSLEDLKHQTALRLAHEQRESLPDGDASSEINATGAEEMQLNQLRQGYQHSNTSHFMNPREPTGPSQYTRPQVSQMSPNGLSSAPHYHGRDYPHVTSYAHYDTVARDYDSRHFIDSTSGQSSGFSDMPLFPSHSPVPANRQQYQASNIFSSPQQARMPRHATVLQDRGSAENRHQQSDDRHCGSDHLGGSDMGYGWSGRANAKPVTSPQPVTQKINRTAAQGKTPNKLSKAKQREPRPTDGRRTPTRDRNIEGQKILFATPNNRRDIVSSTPSSVYSEPPRNKVQNRHFQSSAMSPALTHLRIRTPDHNNPKAIFYGKTPAGKQSKLPHGLTVQELKEMTRARLAAEAAEGTDGTEKELNDYFQTEISSNQSVGTQSSSKGSDQGPNHHYVQFRKNSTESVSSGRSGVSHNYAQSNESLPRSYSNQGLNSQSFPPGQRLPQLTSQQQQQQQHHLPHPRQHSPAFGSGPNQLAFQSNQLQKDWKPQPDAWETSSVASTLASEYQGSESAFPASAASSAMPFSSPNSDAGVMAFNRGRSFSAGMGAPSSFDCYTFEEQQQAAMFDAPPAGVANRRRCATMSPPGMSRLHEDRPFLFSGDDKERLSIPPLSESHLRIQSAGLNNHGVLFHSLPSSANALPNVANGSAFEPIGRGGNVVQTPKSPPSMTAERVKFKASDRALSTGSNISIHGDLPSSMAESVLESFSSGVGGPVDGGTTKDSLFRLDNSSNKATSVPGYGGELQRESGNGSLFSSGPASIFPPDNSGERFLGSLGTNSWGGVGNSFLCNVDGSQAAMTLSHDFTSLLNISETNNNALRGRASTAPCFGDSQQWSPLLVSRIDPEHVDKKGPQYSPNLSSILDRTAPVSGFYPAESFNHPPGFETQGHHSFSSPVPTPILPPSDSGSAAGETYSSESTPSSHHNSGNKGKLKSGGKKRYNKPKPKPVGRGCSG